MNTINIKTVKLQNLVYINYIETDENLPYELRIEQFLEQIKNPFYSRVGKIYKLKVSSQN